ncbi:MAG TPA: hypothetical protein VK501_13970 [Baekduia sp.]|uniref:hypothetical protein n=1 Tax=Baekduia sp. TaxID=2600305 RepID=UPI002C4A2AF1|nr:hypothetical protein [Baekduia sp.]HMJ35015.1 hypothetical protein [Baekduia sp.]
MARFTRMTQFIGAAVASSVAVLAATALAAPVANAAFEITSFGGSASINGEFSRQAGAHADLTTEFRFPATPALVPVATAKTITVDLPPGVVGNPRAAATCTNAELVGGTFNGVGQSSVCPQAAQIGIVRVFTQPNDTEGLRVALYNMERPPDLPGLFAFNLAGVTVRIVPRVRSTDYGISATAPSVSEGIKMTGTRVELWAVPADPSHDLDRFVGDSMSNDNVIGNPPHPSDAPRRPFLTNATSCDGNAAVTSAEVDTWQNRGVFATASFDRDFDGTPFVMEGCDRLPFDPSMTVQPLSHETDAPTGLNVDITIPQSDEPYGLATAHLRKAVVTLPEGMSVSPSSAAGLGACAPSQIGIGTDAPVTCPSSSKIGTITIDTPLLDDPIQGDVILAKQNDNPFRSLLALYLVAKGPGVLLKLPGRVDPDPKTGRLVATFDNNPQLPFTNLHLAFRGGSKASLATPTACGTYNTHAEFTSWASDTPVSLDTPMVIDEGCGPRGFAPAFAAGAGNPVAGAYSPFTLTFSRKDGEQTLGGLDVTLPAGLVGNVASVPRCPEDQAATGSCPAASRIGYTEALAGPGSTPMKIPEAGKAPTAVYLSGPYKGAPFSLSVLVPAQAGPFDLGTVVVRAALFIDPVDAHVTVKSDPLPTIVEGIPLRLRQVSIIVDRPGFMLNPTSCAPSVISAAIFSAEGSVANVASRFQVGDCAALALSPKLAIDLTGKGQTTDGKHPGVKATLTQLGGQSNLKKVSVKLPLSLALDPDNAQALCEFADGQKAEPTCPKGSIVGTATARTPILDEPLTGPVYFVKNVRFDKKTGAAIRTLPTLAIPLKGSGVSLIIRASSSVVKNQLVTTFDNIPDAPVSGFQLNIDGGKHGILAVSNADICKASQVANREIDGQNNKQADGSIYMGTSACTLRVLSSSLTKTALTVRVGGLGAGKVSVSGAGITKTTRKVTKSTVASITAKLTKAGRRHRPTKVKVTFTPAGSKKSKAMTASLSRASKK